MNREQPPPHWSNSFLNFLSSNPRADRPISATGPNRPPPLNDPRTHHHHPQRPHSFFRPWSMPPLGSRTMTEVTNDAIAGVPDHHYHHHRINLDESSSSLRSHQSLTYQSTHDGDVLVVQPSFDDPGRRTPTGGVEFQARSPDGVNKSIDFEQRNPSSPGGKSGALAVEASGHSRNLSSHFFDAASFKEKEEEYIIDGSDGRKHRRLFSSDISLPGQLHRRLDSLGGRGTVRRDGGMHHREDSAGLEMLSAVADASKEDLAAAVGAPAPASGSWEPPAANRQEPARRSPTEAFDQRTGYAMPPPSHSSRPSQSSMSSYSLYGAAMQHLPYPVYPSHYSYPPHPVPRQYQPPHPGAAQIAPSRPYSHVPSDVPPVYSQDPVHASSLLADSWSHPPQQSAKGGVRTQPSHRGSQTFVTAMAVGSGNVTLEPTKSTKNAATNTATEGGSSIPSHIQHHRKMSSFGSIGTLLGSGLFSTPMEPERPGHHRKTSSTISFLGDLSMGLESADAAFMKNLQASVNADVSDFPIPNPPKPRIPSSVSTMPTSPLPIHPLKVSSEPALEVPEKPVTVTETEPTSHQDDESGSTSWDDSSSKLASGGTSKRLRRKCTVQGCQNRVVQGGLCISHGAKRKTCKHPGCTKNVKKAGLCSTHGPARKRCDQQGCSKVAVQGGRCIAHGAKKKLCTTNGCTKQAILGGMCKKHHDQALARGATVPSQPVGEFCQVVSVPASKPASHKAHHTRGLSIFAEISPDAVSTILNDGPPPTNPNASVTDRPAEMW